MSDWSAERRRGRRRAARRAGAGATAGPRARSIDSRDGRARRPLRRPAGRARTTAARFAAQALGRRRLGRARRARARRRRARSAGAASCSPPTTRSPRCRRLATAWRRELGAQVVGDHRLDRQDLDEGHPRRDARAAAAASSPPTQNLNTEIGLPLTRPRRARRDRGARARDGDARRGPDRRAGARSPSPTSA